MLEQTPQTVLNKVKQDKFILIINTPPALKQFQTRSDRSDKLLNLDKMQYSVVGVNIPSHVINEQEISYMGQTTHVTSQTRAKHPVSKVNFTIDNNFDNYWYVWKWLYILNNPTDSGMDEHFSQFEVTGQIPLDAMRKDLKGDPIKYKHIEMKNMYDDYQTTISLYGLREYNEKIIKFDFDHAFITELGGFDYNYQNIDDIACSFSFAYGQVRVSLVDPI